jgi:hypothetical protein
MSLVLHVQYTGWSRFLNHSLHNHLPATGNSLMSRAAPVVPALSLLVVGDVMLGRYVNDALTFSADRKSGIWGDIVKWKRARVNPNVITAGNLECASECPISLYKGNPIPFIDPLLFYSNQQLRRGSQSLQLQAIPRTRRCTQVGISWYRVTTDTYTHA